MIKFEYTDICLNDVCHLEPLFNPIHPCCVVCRLEPADSGSSSSLSGGEDSAEDIHGSTEKLASTGNKAKVHPTKGSAKGTQPTHITIYTY